MIQQQPEMKNADGWGNTKANAPVSRGRQEQSTFEKVMKSPVTKSIAVEITRGILGVLGLGALTSRSRSRSTTSRSKR